MTTRADQVIADAVAAVIAARITAVLLQAGVPAEKATPAARRASHAAVADLRRDGWHITALPTTHHTPESPR